MSELIKNQNPCEDCPKAEWIDMYGKIIWGCNMEYCVMESEGE